MCQLATGEVTVTSDDGEYSVVSTSVVVTMQYFDDSNSKQATATMTITSLTQNRKILEILEFVVSHNVYQTRNCYNFNFELVNEFLFVLFLKNKKRKIIIY